MKFEYPRDAELASIVAQYGINLSEIPALIAHIALRDARTFSPNKTNDRHLERSAKDFLQMDLEGAKVKQEAKRMIKEMSHFYSIDVNPLTQKERHKIGTEICEQHKDESVYAMRDHLVAAGFHKSGATMFANTYHAKRPTEPNKKR